MTRMFIISLAVLLVGCASHKSVTFAEFSREVILSNAHPEDSYIDAKLMDIAPDGTVTIQVLKTGHILQAPIGGYFVSGEYGRIGLQVISASSEKHEAKLLRRSGG